jgi:hypothetical protein
VDAGSSF